MSDEKHTVVEAGTQIRGSISSSCPVVVRGAVEGEISSPALTISATGSISGKGSLGSLVSDGRLAGQFEAETVRLAGSVESGTVIRAKSIDVKLGGEGQQQVSFGDVSLAIGDAPADDG